LTEDPASDVLSTVAENSQEDAEMSEPPSLEDMAAMAEPTVSPGATTITIGSPGPVVFERDSEPPMWGGATGGTDIAIDPSSMPQWSGVKIEEVAELQAALQALREEVAVLKQALPMANRKGIYAATIAPATCPECGLRLNGGSLTAAKDTRYEHPFSASPNLSGAQCRHKGKRYRAPMVFLEEV
jgi:hypothetical protein